MKPFHFSLESVGTVRRRSEQTAGEKYAASLRAEAAAAGDLARLDAEVEDCRRERTQAVTAGCTAEKAVQLQGWESVLWQRRAQCVRALEAAARRVQADLQSFLQARRRREIVDKFFDREKARYHRAVAVAEQKELDEMAGRRGGARRSWNPSETRV